MSIIYVANSDNQFFPTQPGMLAYWILRRALLDERAKAAFSFTYNKMVYNFSPGLLRLMAKAKHDRRLPSPHDVDPLLRMAIGNLFEVWCHEWAGWSDEIMGMACTEALATFYGRKERKATIKDYRIIVGMVGGTPDPGCEALLNLSKPRSEGSIRAEARRRLYEQGFEERQEATLTRWANIWWRTRIDPGRPTVEEIARNVILTRAFQSPKDQIQGEEDIARGMDKRTLLKNLEPWDNAAGYVRKPGRPTKVSKEPPVKQPIS